MINYIQATSSKQYIYCNLYLDILINEVIYKIDTKMFLALPLKSNNLRWTMGNSYLRSG